MYKLNIKDNIYHMILLTDSIPKVVSLNTKNYVKAKERAERYVKELYE